MVRGFDMQNYSPHNPWYNWQPADDGTVASAINWYHTATKQQGIVTFFWHWFSPFGGQLRTSTFYTNYTDFDVSKAVVSGTAEYNATIRDIDAIAVQLKKLQASKIPVLWRPLHEAGGKWFWWGAKGNTAAISLYRLMFDRITNFHAINNLIWVWSTPEADWYPGNIRVDMIGYDSYPGNYNYDCLQGMYNQLNRIVNGQKMIAMTENGPIPELENCLRTGVKWGFFMSWSDLVFSQNSVDHIKAIYSNPAVKTLTHMLIPEKNLHTEMP
jgi:mannan endo-1,4-beta-mannosidase